MLSAASRRLPFYHIDDRVYAMKILLISDVHANIHALEAVERAERFDEVWCCGDLTDFGPDPVEVIRWMQAHIFAKRLP